MPEKTIITNKMNTKAVKFTPQMWYDSEKVKLEESFKNSVKQLDHKLSTAQIIPSLSWYIFEGEQRFTQVFFAKLELKYIEDIHGVVKSWIEGTNIILKNPNIKYRKICNIPLYISHFFNDILTMLQRNACVSHYNCTKYHKQYIAFYKQTIEPCFELQARISRQMKVIKKCIKDNPIENDVCFDWRLFPCSYTNNCFLEGDVELHKRQYKKSLRVVNNAERVELVKLFFSKYL